MRALTSQESKELDEMTSSKLKMSDELMMENVASQCAHFLSQLGLKKGISKFFIWCGPGNNGGDGFAIARLLFLMGFECRVFAQGEAHSPLLKKQRERLKALNVTIENFDALSEETNHDVIAVDAVFGVGLRRDLAEPFLSVIRKINSLDLFTVSIDNPSGLDVDRGVELGVAVRADLTLTIAAPKPGFFTADGPLCVGKIKIISGPFGRVLFSDSDEKYSVIPEREIKSWIPRRSKRSHKGSVGKCHIIAGSKRYLGAGRLCALGALASGSPSVQLYGAEELRKILKDLPEVIVHLEIDELFDALNPMDSVVIGPGLESSSKHKKLIEKLIDKGHEKVLLDAGVFETLRSIKKPLPVTWVCTPHPGELGRLLSESSKNIEEDRFHFVKAAQEEFGCQFLLKGYQPILRTANKEWWCLPYGDSRLGKAGSGDILAGLAGGLMAQMSENANAISLAVYFEAKAATILTRGRNRHSLLVSELPSAIGKLLL